MATLAASTAPPAPRSLRVMTWNVNGLRAVLQRDKTKLSTLLCDLDADIVCFQETKLTRSELDDELVRPQGFNAFYSFCRVRSGYAGVVTFVKSNIPTMRAEEGLTGTWKTETPVGHYATTHHALDAKSLADLEAEGRCVITDHDAFVLLNVYCPALRNAERLEYKLAFHALLHDRVVALERAGKRVIVVGDINIAHRPIDHCDPSDSADGRAFSDHPCRRWMDTMLLDVDVRSSGQQQSARDDDSSSSRQLVDAFRYFHPLDARAFTCWNTKTGARQTNFGTRIDYIFVDATLVRDAATDCIIQPNRMGSDHCPVLLSMIVSLRHNSNSNSNSTIAAALCAKHYVEFAGKQQGIRSFLTASRGSSSVDVTTASISGSSHKRLRGDSSRKPNQATITTFFRQQSTVAATPSTKRSLQSTRPPPPPSAATTAAAMTATTIAAVDADDDDTVDIAQLMRAFEAKERAAASWRDVLSGAPRETPLCHCAQPSVLRTVVKTNDNYGRKFYVCTKPEGEKGHPDARCEFFQWQVSDARSSNSKRLRSSPSS